MVVLYEFLPKRVCNKHNKTRLVFKGGELTPELLTSPIEKSNDSS